MLSIYVEAIRKIHLNMGAFKFVIGEYKENRCVIIENKDIREHGIEGNILTSFLSFHFSSVSDLDGHITNIMIS